MHFDLVNTAAKKRAQQLALKRRTALEPAFRRRVQALLDAQWKTAAEHAKHGVFDVERVVRTARGPLIKAFSEHYTRVGSEFFASVERSFAERGSKGSLAPKEVKGMVSEFWGAFHNWVLRESNRKVVDVTEATRRMIRRTIYSEQDAGGSYDTIADAITEKAKEINKSRAIRIARTETHVASTMSVQEAVRSTRMRFEREWVAVMDDRTRPYPGDKDVKWDHRKANGQRRAMDQPFDVSGEHLMVPGDPKGSAGNIIQCR
jgi:hypothetical protein